MPPTLQLSDNNSDVLEITAGEDHAFVLIASHPKSETLKLANSTVLPYNSSLTFEQSYPNKLSGKFKWRPAKEYKHPPFYDIR